MKKEILINLRISMNHHVMHDQNFYAFILFVIIKIKMDNMNAFNIFKINDAMYES